MLKAGIIDPAKVTRSAVENAASIAAHDPHHRGPHHRQARGEGSGHACRAAWAAWTTSPKPLETLDTNKPGQVACHLPRFMFACSGERYSPVVFNSGFGARIRG